MHNSERNCNSDRKIDISTLGAETQLLAATEGDF